MVNDLILKSKETFYNGKIEDCDGDQNLLFKVIDKILHNNDEPQLPSHNSLDELVNKFADYFTEKIQSIREQITGTDAVNSVFDDENVFIGTKLPSLLPASEDEVRTLISRSSNKSCCLDPIPAQLIKLCMDELVPIITLITNMSLTSGVMPSNLKEAVLIPLLKKICLDPELFKNFRPVSNLTFLSKLIELVVALRLHDHMKINNLYEEFQSSYRKFHSTETALTSVHDDILRHIDEKQCVILLLLDLSAAFDTIDHNILLSRLQSHLGVCDVALQWFKSYLSERKQSVLINGVNSKSMPLTCGVPQGSVLGPILFTIYMLPLGKIISRHGLQYHMYADDCQLYTTFSSTNGANCVANMEALICDIRGWYAKNMLKLNDDKTEMLIIGSKYRQIPQIPDLHVGSSVITPASHVKNLGVIMDDNFTMEPHINNIMRAAFFKIREISYYRRFLTPSCVKTLIHAYITSKLDYCNGLLYGLPSQQLNRLQSILNTAARLVTMTRKYDHVTPILRDLHWIPVNFRVQFKILLQVYKALHGLAPSYLSSKTSLRPNKGLRSDNQLLLDVPKSTLQLKYYGDRAFSVAGPTLWNALPKEIRLCKSVDSFKSNLKTHFFKKAFAWFLNK